MLKRTPKNILPPTEEDGSENTTKKSAPLIITPPKTEIAPIRIRGTAPYVQHKFGEKAKNTLQEIQLAGEQRRKNRKREPKDFDALYKSALYETEEGWHGIPCSNFRNGMISQCRTAGFRMTLMKQIVFIMADGWDEEDGTPLVRITKGTPAKSIKPARNSDGSTDLRCRPMWKPGWEALVRVRYSTDHLTSGDVVNLVARVGLQGGVGEGRPDSRQSCGIDWGLFEIIN